MLVEDYIRFYQKTIIFWWYFEVLDYLNQKYKLHIITNGFAAVQYKINNLTSVVIFKRLLILKWQESKNRIP
jgi:putative hydrolase of the HAD superfamily